MDEGGGHHLSGFAVIIVAYRSLPDLPKCLGSLSDPQQPDLTDIAVVINPPDDGSHDFIRTHFPQVKVVVAEKNLGFAHGNNLGAALFPDADFYFFLNPDAAVPPHFFPTLREFFATHPHATIVGLKTRSPDGTLQLSARAFTTPLDLFRLRSLPLARLLGHDAEGLALARLGELTEPTRYDWVAGLALAMRGDVFRRLGGFDPGYFVFVEDMDLCWRAKQIGWETWFLPEPQVWHKWGGSVGRLGWRKALVHLSALWRFFRRRYDLGGWLEKALFPYLWLWDRAVIQMTIPHAGWFIKRRNY
jgi:N-acetylglucosaminyl-diphospho-decaprenol L-rhamnosyltransferase